MNQDYVELRDITKTFGSVKANDHINFSIRQGEIHALLGENGSGKSTLMNILSGIYTPDSGEILLDGKPIVFHSPADSIRAGIGMVHQHFKLVEVFSAKENIVAGEQDRFWLHSKALSAEIKKLAERYTLHVDPDKKVYRMAVSEKQTVEILKVLYRGAQVLILDEPTAVLTPQETRTLFEILRNMKAMGCAVVIITHKLNEVMEISDRVTVLRKGRSIETLNTVDTNARALTEMMVGHAMSLDIARVQVDPSLIQPILEVENLSVMGPEHIPALDRVSFTLSSGEILGVAGIAGSGQKELCESIAGLEHISGGDIHFKGSSLLKLTPRDIIVKGITMSFVPEDRLGMGLVGSMSIVDNVLLKAYQSMPGIFINRKKGKVIANEIIKRFDISTPGPYHEVKKLSGGNIQKVLLGREINLNPELLITAYPVRGLDIGASYNIYDVLNEQKQKGVGILFIGEDLDVLLSLCDRIMVLHTGRIMAILDARSATKEEVGLLMLGHTVESDPNEKEGA